LIIDVEEIHKHFADTLGLQWKYEGQILLVARDRQCVHAVAKKYGVEGCRAIHRGYKLWVRKVQPNNKAFRLCYPHEEGRPNWGRISEWHVEGMKLKDEAKELYKPAKPESAEQIEERKIAAKKGLALARRVVKEGNK
jgi:hypothetical protein